MKWQDFIVDWLSFKREMGDFKIETKLSIKEVSKGQESILTNHLPHMAASIAKNSGRIKSLRKYLWLIIVVGILIVIEADKTAQLFNIIKGFLGG